MSKSRNPIFLDAYYLLAETVKKGILDPIITILINIHTKKYASLERCYNKVPVKEKEIELKNLILKNVNDLKWV